MAKITIELDMSKINKHDDVWAVRVNGPIMQNRGIRLDARHESMGLRRIAVESDHAEICGLQHCNIESFQLFTDEPENVYVDSGGQWIKSWRVEM